MNSLYQALLTLDMFSISWSSGMRDDGVDWEEETGLFAYIDIRSLCGTQLGVDGPVLA